MDTMSLTGSFCRGHDNHRMDSYFSLFLSDKYWRLDIYC